LFTDRLVEHGFAAVPRLIDHLGDNRLTRYQERWIGITGIPPAPFYYRVGDFAGDVLSGVSAGKVRRGSTQGEAEDWWAEARKEGEEEYWVRHALSSNGWSVEDRLVRLIGRKYPSRLAELYRTVLEGSRERSSDSLAEAIRTSSLPRETKVRLLAPATRHENPGHRRVALEQLSDLAPDLFTERLIEALEELQVKRLPFSELGPEEVAYVWLVTRTSDARVWKALETTTRRSGVGLRMEYLKMVARWEAEDKRRKERLAFLTAFLGDTTVRDLNRDIQWKPFFAAAGDFPQLSVRNLAALYLAEALEFEDKPRSSWGEAEWAELRRKVRDGLRQGP
jgi:hypothetical protein